MTLIGVHLTILYLVYTKLISCNYLVCVHAQVCVCALCVIIIILLCVHTHANDIVYLHVLVSMCTYAKFNN